MAILINNEYRIVKIDSRNLSFEKLCDIKKKNGITQKEWVQVGGYYPNLDFTCKALKDYIVNDSIDNCTNVYEVIELLTDVQIRYNTIDFIIKEDNKCK